MAAAYLLPSLLLLLALTTSFVSSLSLDPNQNATMYRLMEAWNLTSLWGSEGDDACEWNGVDCSNNTDVKVIWAM
jgi:hypothetical protein